MALLQRFVAQGADIPWFLQHVPAKAVYEFALRKYEPSYFAGKVTWFRAATPGDPHAVHWQARSVRVVEVDGEARSLLEAPHVSRIAREILRRTLRALAEGAGQADAEPQSASAA